MYGKEIEQKINIQSGGGEHTPSSEEKSLLINNDIRQDGGEGATNTKPLDQKELSKNIENILDSEPKTGIFGNIVNMFSSSTSFTKNSLYNFSSAYRKYIRITIMILFFLFFYKILMSILNFFDVDEIHSNTYILWLSIVLILYTLLPIKKSYLSSKTSSSSEDTNNSNSYSSILHIITILFVILSILSGIFYRY